jgi:hypothetical protein
MLTKVLHIESTPYRRKGFEHSNVQEDIFEDIMTSKMTVDVLFRSWLKNRHIKTKNLTPSS